MKKFIILILIGLCFTSCFKKETVYNYIELQSIYNKDTTKISMIEPNGEFELDSINNKYTLGCNDTTIHKTIYLSYRNDTLIYITDFIDYNCKPTSTTFIQFNNNCDNCIEGYFKANVENNINRTIECRFRIINK